MDIPDLVQRALGDEEIRTGVSLGDEDVVCLTPTRVLVYNGEGLISDEGVEEFPLDTERLSIKRSRRKTKFTLQYIEGPQSFTVPANRGEDVLERLLEGVLRVDGVLDDDESVAGVYLFSELTLVVTDRRVVKHIGGAVWDEDFETYDFVDVTGLDFEQTSVATSIVVGIDGHPQRVKVPSDTAPLVRRALQEALFEFHDVSSLDELNRVLGEDDELDVDETSAADDLTFGSGIDPLVTDRDDGPAKGVEDPFATGPADEDAEADAAPGDTVDAVGTPGSTGADAIDHGGGSDDAAVAEPSGPSDDPLAGEDWQADEPDPTPEVDSTGGSGAGDASADGPESGASDTADGAESADADTADDEPASTAAMAAGADTGSSPAGVPADPADVATSEDIAAVADRLEELTDAVDRQNELLKRQHRAMKQLVERLDEE
jgi:hypothetical protein